MEFFLCLPQKRKSFSPHDLARGLCQRFLAGGKPPGEVYVEKLFPKLWAEKQGLRLKDVLEELNGQRLSEMFLDRTCPRSEDSEGFKVHFLQEHTTCFLSQLAQLIDLFFCLSQAADIGIFLLFTTHFALLTSSKCGWTFAFSPFLH